MNRVSRSLLVVGIALAMATGAQAQVSCDRACMSGMVDKVLASMVAHNPYTLPLAKMYEATENSHPAALGMLVSWRSITKAGKPDLLAIDPIAGQAFFMLTVSESGSPSVLFGRIKVVDKKITELEIFINRSRGDHGFSFSPEELPGNFKKLMSPPADRKKASRAELEQLAEAAFDPKNPFKVDVSPTCQFTEVGWSVVDPGLDDQPMQAMPPAGASGPGGAAPGGAAPAGGAPSGAPGAGAPPAGMKKSAGGPPKDMALGCMFPPSRPADPHARVLVIDEDLGFVVVGAVNRGVVYPYPYYGKMISAFIPDGMEQAMQTQDEWIQRKLKKGSPPLLKPMHATGDQLQVLQYYDGKLQAEQIDLHLSGKEMLSDWVDYSK